MRLYGIALIAVTLSAGTVAMHESASAQQDSQEWLEQCRRERNNRERACEIRTETFRSTGELRVDAGQNGGVSVESWSGTEVSVEARIQATADDASRAAEIAKAVRVAHSGSALQASGPDMSREDHESWSVMYVVKVPRATNLDLTALNGPLGVRNVRGKIVANTTNGPLSLTDVAGDVHARTQNGPMSVKLSGARWEGAGLDAETKNGPLTLSIPEGYNADLETGTYNGPFSTDVPLEVRVLGNRTSRIQTKIGDGGAPVRAVTSNGPVTIRRR
jgi:hypothetical protein